MVNMFFIATVGRLNLTCLLLAGVYQIRLNAVNLLALVLTAALLATLVILVIAVKKYGVAKKRLENTERLFSSFLNAEKDNIYLKDENLKYIMVNKALADFYGKKPEDIVGLDDYDLTVKETADIRRNTDKNALKNMAVTEELVSYDNNTSVSIKFPVLLPNGKYGVGAHVRNITKELNHEKIQAKLLQRAEILIGIESKEFKDRQETLDYVLRQTVELSDSKYGYIYLYDEDTKKLTPYSCLSNLPPESDYNDSSEKYPPELTDIFGEVIRQRKHFIINNLLKSDIIKTNSDSNLRIKRIICIPIYIDEKIVAVVGMADKEEEYDENDYMNLIVVLGGSWQAIHRRAVQEQLAYERNRYRQTLISIGDGVLITDGAGNIEMLNKVARELTGWSNEEAHGRPYREVFLLSHEEQGKSIDDPIEEVLKTKTIQVMGNHALLTSKDGSTYNIEDSAAPIFNEAGECAGVVLVFRDVTLKKEQRKRIEYLSYHDLLTGLYNRSFFEEELKRLDAERNLPISILMGDVNGLKLTNDIFGHAYGDMLLKTLADVFRHTCRSDDIIARWGGDEFVILLPKTNKRDADNIAMRIKDEFSNRQIKALKGSISIGIASKTLHVQNISDILDEAEEIMYSIKTLEREAVTDEEISSLVEMFHEDNDREREHSEFVASVCGKIGKSMELSDVELRNLKEAGYLHDIGKIILSKDLPDAAQNLSGAEMSEIKKHPVIGYRILNSSDRTVSLAEAVLAHHEQWNGLGFPKGLKGEEIPMLARIIAVAEYYDRLKNGYYKNKKSDEDIIKFFKDNAGVMFDPHVVEVFTDMLESERTNSI